MSKLKYLLMIGVLCLSFGSIVLADDGAPSDPPIGNDSDPPIGNLAVQSPPPSIFQTIYDLLIKK